MDILLERELITKAWFDDRGFIMIKGILIDDMHHIEAVIAFDYDLEKVVAIDEVKWVRAPYAPCSDVAQISNRIIGLEVKTGATAIINHELGESDGCIHLAEVVVQIFKCFFQVKHRVEDRKLQTEEERKSRKYRVLRNSCYAYTDKVKLSSSGIQTPSEC